jgi:precorrin-6B methylase 2
MNSSLKRSLLTVLGNPIIKPLFWVVTHAAGQRKIWLSFAKNYAEKLFLDRQPSEPTVLDGPFKGLRYSVIQSVGSVLAPKILGTYEKELFQVWDNWRQRGYKQILDIGCAEGFYAVGSAMIWPTAMVYAYDVEPTALELTMQLAKANGVSERVKIEGACSAATLASFPFQCRSLIISDCEGYEAELFNRETLPFLDGADIVIEVHEQAGSGFMTKVEKWTAQTHKATRIVTQERKAGESPFLEGYTHYNQKLILSEVRDGVFGTKKQHWLVLESLRP